MPLSSSDGGHGSVDIAAEAALLETTYLLAVLQCLTGKAA